MSNNLRLLLNFINDKFRFGSILNSEEIQELFRKYPIDLNEKNRVYDELKSLEIKLIYGNTANDKKKHKSDNIIEDKKEKEMCSQNKCYEKFDETSGGLLMIVDYINDNFRFGSTLNGEQIEEMFRKYSIGPNEKNKVYDELKALEIKIIYGNNVNDKKNYNFDNVIKDKIEKEVCDTRECNDENSPIDLKNFEFLDGIDFEDLDSILEDHKFIEELARLEDIINKKYNLEYLADYHSEECAFEKRKHALNNLINANQNLVWRIVSRYKHFVTVSFDENDMYQAGMQGLLKAAERFDVNMGNQFSTYATWWIMQSIARNIADYSTTIRIPVHMRERIQKYVKFQNDFWNRNGCIASNEEAANALEISEEEIVRLQNYKEITNLRSLDVPIGEDESSFLGEFVADIQQKTPEECAEENALKREIKDLFETKLTPREVKILDSRFGLTDNQEHTLEEIGQDQNVTRERVRQIEAKAIKKLSSPRNKERLKDFYYD